MEHESVLKLDNLFFEKIDYERKIVDEKQPQKYSYNFTRNISATDDEHFIVSLQCNIKSEDEDAYKLSITVTGWFCCQCQDENVKRILIEQNAIAIMFPYLRSQIILVTTQPNSVPIQLPVINIAALFSKDDE